MSKPTHIIEFEKRFWNKVIKDDVTDCWNWQANKVNGYGRIKYREKMTLAHRLSWRMARGNIPDNMNILHSCDNPSCVNPDHLYIGTHTDNMQDMISRNRRSYPINNIGKFYSGEAYLMWKLLDNKISHRTIAKIFKCSKGTPYYMNKIDSYLGKDNVLERRI